MINASINFGLNGKVRLISHKGDPESPSHDTGVFSNIFTRNGLNLLLGSSTIHLRPVVGSGNATPLVSDTSLQSFVAGGSSDATSAVTTRNSEISPYGVKHTIRWRFAQGAAAGNIAEVGLANIFNATPIQSTPLVTRALVKDSSGNPTSVTVLSDEFLDVIYEITISAPELSSGDFVQMIDGVSTSTAYSIGPAEITSGTYWEQCSSTGISPISPSASPSNDYTFAFTTSTLGPPSGRPSGAGSRFSSASSGALNTSSSFRDFSFTASLDSANISIGSILLRMIAASFQISLSPSVVKVNSKTYTITLRVSVSNAA